MSVFLGLNLSYFRDFTPYMYMHLTENGRKTIV